MGDLEKILGEAITVKELAEYLGVNETSIRKNYRQYGGIRVGRHYRFFSKEVISAIQKQTEKQVHSASQEERKTAGKGIRKIEPGQKLGGSAAQNVRRRVERNDRHGLLD